MTVLRGFRIATEHFVLPDWILILGTWHNELIGVGVMNLDIRPIAGYVLARRYPYRLHRLPM